LLIFSTTSIFSSSLSITLMSTRSKRHDSSERVSEDHTPVAAKKAAAEVPVTSASAQPAKLMWVTVMTENVRTSAKWYSDLFGWKEGHVEDRWGEIDSGSSTKIGFHIFAKEDPPGSVHLSFVVPSLDTLHAKVSADKGVTILKPPTREPWGGYKAEYRAPDGSTFDVLQQWDESSKKHADEASSNNGTTTTTTAAAAAAATASSSSKKHDEDVKKKGSHVCWTTIPVGNLERAKKFYSQVFGWKFTDWKLHAQLFQTGADTQHSGHLEVSDKRLEVAAIWLNVDDIDATLEKVKLHGGQLVKPKGPIDDTCPQVGTTATFKDSEGNAIFLYLNH